MYNGLQQFKNTFGLYEPCLYSILHPEPYFLLLFGHLVGRLSVKSVFWVLYTETVVLDGVSPSKDDQIHL